ncbi:MAG: hypothetical protein F6K31_12220 [Symploca sp. SIO2G7]|nr:hypothetical protein [Symploca sp. SIO2G7]
MFKKIKSGIAFVVLFGAIFPFSQAQAQSKYWRIRAEHTGGCLAIEGASNNRARLLHLPRCDKTANFAFWLETLNSGYRIHPAHSNGCLAVAGASRSRSVIVQKQQDLCEINEHFIFNFREVGSRNGQPVYNITVNHTGGCIAVAGFSTGRAEVVHVPRCDDTRNFQFVLEGSNNPYFN